MVKAVDHSDSPYSPSKQHSNCEAEYSELELPALGDQSWTSDIGPEGSGKTDPFKADAFGSVNAQSEFVTAFGIAACSFGAKRAHDQFSAQSQTELSKCALYFLETFGDQAFENFTAELLFEACSKEAP